MVGKLEGRRSRPMTTASTASRVSLHSIADSDKRPEFAPVPLKEPRGRTSFKQVLRSRTAIACALLLIVTASVVGLASLSRSSTPGDRQLVFFTVQPRTLNITVTERGTLESQHNVQIICEVDDVQVIRFTVPRSSRSSKTVLGSRKVTWWLS